MNSNTIQGSFSSVRISRAFLLLALAPWLAAAPLAEKPLAKAEELYQQTDYQASLAAVREIVHPAGAEYCLAGRDYYMLGDFKKASEAFEKAFALDPGNSEYAHWLAKSYGRRAEVSSPFTAAGNASKARMYFEKAVALDPGNNDALRDLFDYYLEAPGFLGGGYDKAEAIAKRIAERNPAEGHLVEAELADRRKQFDTAEEELRRAIEQAPRQVGRVLDLARYLARHGRIQESEVEFDRAEKLEPHSPAVAFARARVYVEQKRNLGRAKALLQRYLGSNLTPSDPPRKEAEKLLREVSGA